MLSGPARREAPRAGHPRIVAPFLEAMCGVYPYLLLSTEEDPSFVHDMSESVPDQLRRQANEIENRDKAIMRLRDLVNKYGGLE